MHKLILAISALAVLLTFPGPVAAAPNGDPDRDGVDTRNERRQGTDPQRRDSDRDGRPDGREDADRDGLDNATEDATGNDPINRDSDDDGLRDGREGAGTVTSFADGVLTIRLAGRGGTTAAVTELTDLWCASESQLEHAQSGKRRAAKGYRRGGRRRGGDGSSRRGRANAATTPEDDAQYEDGDDEWGDEPVEEDPGEDEDFDDDEDWSDDEDWDDDDSPAADGRANACEAKLRVGTRVHASEAMTDADGAAFALLELVR